MQNTFDNWHGTGQDLEHSGIPGMKWGVRRYQNRDGSLTALGKARYGAEGTGAKARKMQRDFNNLDQGFARQNAEREQAYGDMRKYATRAAKRALKKGYDTEEKGMADRRVARNMAKAEKASKVFKETEARMKEIASLQMRIIGHAAKKGYTVTSKPVMRMANTGRQLVKAHLFNAFVVGGAIGGAISGAALGATATKTLGSKVKIREKGDGSVSLVNYSGMKRNQNGNPNYKQRDKRRNNG